MINHCGTKSIQTKRLLLRKYQENDVDDIYHNYATDERVTRYLPWPPYTRMQDLAAFISAQISGYSDAVYNWVIEYAGQVIGSVSATVVDVTNECCEIGYCLGYDYWNRGIMAEAVRAVLGYLFHAAGFHRVMAKHDVDNPGSGRVMAKCGMVYEGRLREHYLRHDGNFSDALVYGLLKREYTAV